MSEVVLDRKRSTEIDDLEIDLSSSKINVPTFEIYCEECKNGHEEHYYNKIKNIVHIVKKL